MEPGSLRGDSEPLPWASFSPESTPFPGQVWALHVPHDVAWRPFGAVASTPEGDRPDGSLLLQLWRSHCWGTGASALSLEGSGEQGLRIGHGRQTVRPSSVALFSHL